MTENSEPGKSLSMLSAADLEASQKELAITPSGTPVELARAIGLSPSIISLISDGMIADSAPATHKPALEPEAGSALAQQESDIDMLRVLGEQMTVEDLTNRLVEGGIQPDRVRYLLGITGLSGDLTVDPPGAAQSDTP